MEALRRQIQKRLGSTPMPQELQERVLTAWRRLGNSAVAVRSSATVEDLPGAAFAGQQETFLNVTSAASVIEAIRSCWASLWSERAVAYRRRRGVGQESIAIAVVVQQMVPADAAGVMFTADPISGGRSSIVIDANPGLGEAVVAGLVTPDRFVLTRKPIRLKEHRAGRRELLIRAKEGGGTEQVDAPPAPAGGTVVPSRALRRLARVGIRIERHFGSPQDIEWAWVRDGSGAVDCRILQARPMTALAHPPKVSAAMRLVVPMLIEMWPSRPYPLDVTTFTGALESAVGRFLAAMVGKGAPKPEDALVEEDGVVLRFEPPAARPSPSLIAAVLAAFWRTRRYRPQAWAADPIVGEVIAAARELEAREAAALSWAGVIETLHRALGLVGRAMQLRECYAPPAILKLGGLWLRLAVTRQRNRLGLLLGGVETKTSETNRALEELAGGVRATPALRKLFSAHAAAGLPEALNGTPEGEIFLRGLGEFLARYGHREIGLTISQGAWKDRPDSVLGILKALAAAAPRPAPQIADWERARDQVLAESLLGRRLFRRGFLRALAGARALMQLREDTHFYATMALPVVRRLALELGRRLAQLGVLRAPEGVFHLRLEELEALGGTWPPPNDVQGQLRDLAARRQALRESLASRPLFDPGLLAAVRRDPGVSGVLLTGAPGSPGIARGPVRVIRSEADFGNLLTGDVLVASVTNPAWTPLFTRAAAVVVDAGGAASHAAIVAREYGVPAVMGTGDGTTRLADGRIVIVDGTRGMVLEEQGR